MTTREPVRVEVSLSAFRAFSVLSVQGFQRLWRVRQMGLVSFMLLAIVVGWVLLVTYSPAGWELPDRKVRRGYPTFMQCAELDLLPGRLDPGRYDGKLLPPISRYQIPAVLNPLENSVQTLFLSIPYAVLTNKTFVKNWEFINYSGWVLFGAYLGFVLPLFSLSYATAAFGTERESRSLIWVMTRPIPRAGIYLAKLLGTLPWCLAFGLGGFVILCLAGGEPGRLALVKFWPIAAATTIAFTSLFHFIGAMFRRPIVVGLIYVFFFEALVAALPGSLKLLSLSFYARSLMYNVAEADGYPVDLLDVPQGVSSVTGWSVLALATLLMTVLGMWLFARSEYRDDV